MLFVTIWMDLDGIMLSEISRTETYKCHMISLICGITNKTNERTKQNRKRLTDTENKLVVPEATGKIGKGD